MPQTVCGVGLLGGYASLQIGHHLVEGRSRRPAVGDEHQHEQAEVKRPVDRDQAQHDHVAQGFAPQRQFDLAALWGDSRRMLGPRQRQPAVAAPACAA
jgi:hypothetical protein